MLLPRSASCTGRPGGETLSRKTTLVSPSHEKVELSSNARGRATWVDVRREAKVKVRR